MVNYYKAGIGHACVTEEKIYMHSHITGAKVALVDENPQIAESIDRLFEKSDKEEFEEGIKNDTREWIVYKIMYEATLKNLNLDIILL